MTQPTTQLEKELALELSIQVLENARLRKHIADLSKGRAISPYDVNTTINEKPLDITFGIA